MLGHEAYRPTDHHAEGALGQPSTRRSLARCPPRLGHSTLATRGAIPRWRVEVQRGAHQSAEADDEPERLDLSLIHI
eukprot:15040004-Alexandrium_andersonii.AAC.1